MDFSCCIIIIIIIMPFFSLFLPFFLSFFFLKGRGDFVSDLEGTGVVYVRPVCFVLVNHGL